MRRLAVVVILALGCGDDGGSTIRDAAPVPDGDDVDAPGGQAVKLTVTSDGGGVAGIRVHFQNPDSTLITSGMTDANGVASALMPDGGFVTAINPFGASTTEFELHTFAAVEPGDELVLKDFGGESVSTVTVTGPSDADGAVTHYLFSTPCDDTTAASPQAELVFYGACLTSTDVLVASLDGNDEIVHWLYAANQTQAGGALDLSAMAITAAPTTKTLTYNNIPAGAGGIQIMEQLHSQKGAIVSFDTGGAGTTVTTMLKLPAFANALDVSLGRINGPFGFHGFVDWGPFSSSYTTDIAARMLPEATSGPAFDVTTRRATWTEAAGGQTPDFVLAFAYSERAPNIEIEWAISAPYSAGQVQFPTLPVEGSVDLNFQATDTSGVEAVILGKVPGGYDGVRERLQALDGPQDIATSASGTMTYEEIPEAGVARALRAGPGKGARTSVAPAWKSRRRM